MCDTPTELSMAAFVPMHPRGSERLYVADLPLPLRCVWTNLPTGKESVKELANSVRSGTKSSRIDRLVERLQRCLINVGAGFPDSGSPVSGSALMVRPTGVSVRTMETAVGTRSRISA